jgi:hypothetical protein
MTWTVMKITVRDPVDIKRTTIEDRNVGTLYTLSSELINPHHGLFVTKTSITLPDIEDHEVSWQSSIIDTVTGLHVLTADSHAIW